MFRKALLPAFRLLVVLTVVTGVIYPLAITLIAQLAFPMQANGSLLVVDGHVVGSSLIGQDMTNEPRYFWTRPSSVGYNPLPSGGSNLSITSATLQAEVQQRRADFIAQNHLPADTLVPPEMLYASASGIDPHISPESARLQIDRLAEARNLPREMVAQLVAQYVEAPQFGFLGQARVNVLQLNVALDALPR